MAVPISPSLKCPICLDDMRDRAVVIPCCHDFDYRCINEWTGVNSNCPVCRTGMESIHHNIKSNLTFCVQYVVPTASASADHDDDDDTDDYDSEELGSDTDVDVIDASDGVSLNESDYEWQHMGPMILTIPHFAMDDSSSDGSLHSPVLPHASTPTPPASPSDSVINVSSPGSSHVGSGHAADGTIVLSSDDEEQGDVNSDLINLSDGGSVYEDPAEEVLLMPEDGDLVQVQDHEDECPTDEESEGQSGIDYGDEPDDWTDDFDGDGFEPDFEDGFDDSNHGFD